MKVAIAGYGQEGEASYRYYKELGADITIFDEKQPARPLPEDVKTVFGKDAFTDLNGFDLVIRTASLNPAKIKTDGKLWSATNEFFAQCPAPIIGVTGTKGKGTTCSLIAEILKAAGKTTHLVGNIGVPALAKLPAIQADDVVVFELSSFQLWDLQKSPQTAVVLMIEPDHMDVHTSVQEYIQAKTNIGFHQLAEDLLIYHPNNQYSETAAHQSPARKKRYMTKEGAHIQNEKIIIADEIICNVDEVGLIGEHNLENICAAITASWEYSTDVAAIKKAITTFKGLPHRLEFVREFKGVKYYNDSFSSAPGATIAAIRSFQKPLVLICGGYDKQVDLNPVAKAIQNSTNLKKVLLIGQTGPKIADLLTARNFARFELIQTTDFSEIVAASRNVAESGDIVLLSPGCASFDMFKNFYERGEQFKQLVMDLQ